MKKLLFIIAATGMIAFAGSAMAAPSESGVENRSCNATIEQANKDDFGPPGQQTFNLDLSTKEYVKIKNDFRKANKDTFCLD